MAMPFEVHGRRLVFRPRRPTYLLPVVTQEDFFELARTMCQLGHQHPMVRVDCERSQVEDFVMKGTERDSIGFCVRTSCLVPLDVSCLQGNSNIADAKIEAAHGTTVFIGGQDAISESRIARTMSVR